MANGKNGSWKVYVASGISIAVILGGWLVTWGQTTTKIDTLEVKVEKLMDTRDTTLQLEPRVANIEEDIDEIKENMREGFRAILKKLDEK